MPLSIDNSKAPLTLRRAIPLVVVAEVASIGNKGGANRSLPLGPWPSKAAKSD